MKDYILDYKTGYLTPGPGCIGASFNAAQKVMFLEAFAETANFSKAAKLVGVTRNMVTAHFEGDMAFYQAYRNTVEKLCDDMEGNLFRMAQKTPVAAFGFLKAYRRSIWGDAKQQGNDTTKSTDKLKDLIEEIKKEEKK